MVLQIHVFSAKLPKIFATMVQENSFANKVCMKTYFKNPCLQIGNFDLIHKFRTLHLLKFSKAKKLVS